MSLYKELQKVSSKILKEFKQGEISLIKITIGIGDPDEPGEATEEHFDLDATASGVSQEFMNNGLAVKGDLMVISAVLDNISPSETDFINIDGVRYKIIKILPAPAAGVKTVWKFIVRRGG